MVQKVNKTETAFASESLEGSNKSFKTLCQHVAENSYLYISGVMAQKMYPFQMSHTFESWRWLQSSPRLMTETKENYITWPVV